eukprot:TRINITY_DN19735_c0_g1_i4.p1 TRINITY_DN19735_c0_g1~~TRINITY_DN19735_c0_g1_i4.p1  ORF type:complete len:117 (-),score=0.20 TRINITY_DN19735_c0_g1_i4:167-517(-)
MTASAVWKPYARGACDAPAAHLRGTFIWPGLLLVSSWDMTDSGQTREAARHTNAPPASVEQGDHSWGPQEQRPPCIFTPSRTTASWPDDTQTSRRDTPCLPPCALCFEIRDASCAY